MPSDIDATPGGADANSYATLDYATAYFGDRLHSSVWTGAGADDQRRAMLMAANWLEQQEYDGLPAIAGQALSFPRYALRREYYFERGRYGDRIEPRYIPAEMMDAQCELALILLSSDEFAERGTEAYNSVSVGELNIDIRQAYHAGILPQVVKRLLRYVLAPSGGRVVRG